MEGGPDAQQPQGSPARPSTAAARAGGSKDDEAVAVRVAVHIRPLVDNELEKGCQEILDVTPDTPQISVGLHTFTYDNVYGSGGGDNAANLYPDCVLPLVDGLFRGYNATVFAYGQTGSGKTYTMGSAWSPEEENNNQGVIPNVMDELFTRVEHETNTDFTIKVSFVEIHKEEVRDLLWTNSSGPRPVVTIRELPSGVSLAGACERLVSSREEMSHVLMQGTLMRAVAATNMNNRSSRSHAIFTITLEQRRRQLVRPASAPPAVESTPKRGGLQDVSSSSGDEVEDDSAEDEDEEVEAGDDYLIAKMHLVDLAGSERAKRTGAEGARLKEAININKGLLALAKVITALVDGQSHVPYRDSKLTRLLQDSLGGNSRTVMIACVSPADINREETLNTLRYADRARRIKNKPVVNRDPMAAQLAALRQQIAGLRAENLALRTALGGDKEAAGVIAAAGRGSTVASAALQEAYDDLAVRFNQLELENAKQHMQLESNQEEMKLLRSGLVTAETHRDQLLLRLQALQAATAVSTDPAMKEALAQDREAAAAAATDPARSSDQAAGEGAAAGAGGNAAAGAGGSAAPAAGLSVEVGVVQTLRARVAELETELRQVRSLQRMASSALVRGMSSSMCGSSRALGSRQNSSSGGYLALGGYSRAASRLAAHPIPDISEDGTCATDGLFSDDHADGLGSGGGNGGDLSPVTPARPSGMCGGDLLGEPLMEVAPDAEILAQSAAHMMAREELALKLEVLGRQMEAKQKRLLALQSAATIEGAKSKYMVELQKERDTLAKEKTALLQKLAAVTQAGAEERKRLEQTYKDKLTAVERRLKDLAEKERAAKRNAAQLGRVQSVCQQLQADIARMKAQRASVQRRMEAKEKEFREWRLTREREVIQLRRNAQRQNAALQQHQAMHSKQQAVLKRKTEEAEAARRKLRELTELQARVRRDKQAAAAAAGEASVAAGADLELQPNASAPLLRNSKARREWIEQEMELCSTSWQYQKVLDGELAQRAEATRRLREVQKQLMLLGGLVPPSPVVTAAAAAAARGRRNSGNPLSSGGGGARGSSGGGQAEEAALMQEAKALQEAIDGHTRSVKELQEQWERARAEEQSRGAGAADVRRWTGIRNIVEAREMLRTLFISACTQRAQVCESQMELAKLQESNDILEIRLDMAVQQSAEARRKALEAEATAAAVITTPAHQFALAAAVAAAGRHGSSSDGGGGGSSDGSEGEGGVDAAAAAGAAAAAAADGSTPGEKQLLQSQRSRRLRQQDLLSGGSGGSIEELAERRDPVDIEADSLLHSLGLPSIQEMPSPAEGCSGEQAAGGSGSGAAAAVAERLAARRERYWRGAAGQPSSSGRAGALLRAAADGWPSQEGGSAEGGGRTPGGVPSRRSSATAHDLAAKLDALEGEWQGYKRTAAAAAANGSTRRSLSGGGSMWLGGRRSSSVPASPRTCSSLAAPGGTPLGTPMGRQQLQHQQQRGRRVSLSANNSPVGRAWASQDGEDTPAGDAGRAAGSGGSGSHSGEQQPQQTQQQQGLLLRSISTFIKMGRDAVAAMGVTGGGAGPSPREPVDNIVKSLNFQDIDDSSRQGRSPAHTPSGTPRASRHSTSSSPERLARRRASDMQQQQRQRGRRQQQQDGTGSPALAGSMGPAASNGMHTDEEIFAVDSGDAEDEQSAHRGGRSRRRAVSADGHGGGDDSDEFEDAEDDDGDDEEEDPSYDPLLHATPAAAGRRSSRQSGRHGKGSRAARGSASSEQDGNTSRASSRSRRSSSHQQQQAQQQSTSGAGSGAAAAAAVARNLAAQVSFNHEKRQGWEKPVLEDINSRRAGEGLAPVDKLTIQLLKENLVGQELDGKPWAPGNKTKDILIADYRRVLQLSDGNEEVTSINRITGAANWPMPGSLPTSLPCSPQPGSWAAAARRGADAEAAAVADGAASRPVSAAGARRVMSHSLPPSPSGRDPYRAAIMGSSPLRQLQQQSRIPAGMGGSSHISHSRSPPGQPGFNYNRTGSPTGSASPPLGPSPPRGGGGAPRVSPSPRVVREQQWGGEASPRVSGRGPRGAGRMPSFVSQSLDGSLMQAGAAREQQHGSQVGALQQAPQRTLRSNSSGISGSNSSSSIPGSASKLRVIVPQTTRIDGPYSTRVQATSGAGSSERVRGANGQPNWR